MPIQRLVRRDPIRAKGARKTQIAIETKIATVHRIEIKIRMMASNRTAIATETVAAGVDDADVPVCMRALAVIAFLLYLPTAAQAQPIDPHALFEEKCGRCHEHAGTFAREKLTIANGEVVGLRSGKPVLKTLASHFGKLSDAEAELIVDMFRRQIESGGLFESKCRFCHDPAKDLARQTLVMRNGQLTGRYSGRSIETFLSYHGRLEGGELVVMLDILAWHLTTIADETP